MFLPLLYAKVLLLPVNYFLKLSYLLIHITISFMFLLLLKFIFFKFRAVKINLFVKFLLLTFALNLTLRYFVYSLLFLLFVLSIFFFKQLWRIATQSSDFKNSVKTPEPVALVIKSSKQDSLCLFDSSLSLD